MPQPKHPGGVESAAHPHDRGRPRRLARFVLRHTHALLYGWFWFGLAISALVAPDERVAALNSSLVTEGWHLAVMCAVLGGPVLVLYAIRMGSGRGRARLGGAAADSEATAPAPRRPKKTHLLRLGALFAALALLLAGAASCGPDAPARDTAEDVTVDLAVGDAADRCSHHADCPQSGDPCRPARCLADGACGQEALSHAPCDDGDPCTIDDRCAEGACKGGLDLCQCREDSDCASWEDANLCNGTLYCNLGALPHTCRLNPLTVVKCPADEDDLCRHNVCDPETGQCAMKPRNLGAACQDDDPCTVGDACAGGVCEPGAGMLCDCKVDTDCLPYDDGDACNGSLYCDTAGLKPRCLINPASVVSCSAAQDTACSANVCQPKTGKCALESAKDGAPCDDGLPATASSHCEGGVCKSGPWMSECLKTADCQDDGDACNGTLYCDLGQSPPVCKVNPATIVTCPSVNDSPCVVNTCVPATGKCALTPLANGAACDDGDKCTGGSSEVCLDGKCQAGKPTCKCKKDADCADKDDGDLCNGTMICQLSSGQCALNPATVVTCPTVDDTDCVQRKCVPKTGKCDLHPSADGVACDDGDKCTEASTCQAGKCQGGVDTCACQDNADCADNGNLCDGVPYCDKGATPPECKLNPATIVSCPDGFDKTCLKNTCQPLTGKCQMQAVAPGTKCSDGNACTVNDLCELGKCVGGTDVCECQDNADCLGKDDGNKCNGLWYCDKSGKTPACVFNPASVVWCDKSKGGPCLKEVCDPKTGACNLTPVADGATCDDGNPCTEKDTCKVGGCTGAKIDCDDKNACTADGCAASGCVHLAKKCTDGNTCTADGCLPETGECVFAKAPPEGKICNADDSGCTVNDTCKGGKCVAGTAVSCGGEAGPCEVIVCAPVGADGHKCVPTNVADGTSCPDSSPCLLGSKCKGGGCVAGETEALYVESLPQVPGGSRPAGVAVLADGVIVVGSTLRDKSGASNGRWLLRGLAPGGATLWSHEVTAKAPGKDVALAALARLSTGGVVAVGSMLDGAGKAELVTLRLSAAGKQVWLKHHGAGDGQIGRAVASGQGGAVAVAGSLRKGADRDGVVLWLSAGGQVLETAQPGGAWVEDLWGLALEVDGRVLAVGERAAAAGGKRTGWMVRLSGSGKPLWQRTPGEGGPQALRAVVPMAAGGWMAGGWRQTAGKRRSWLLRVDAAGETIWSRVSSGSFDILDLAPRPGGGVFAAGTANPTAGGGDMWLMATDALGNAQWHWSHGKLAPEAGTAVASIPGGGVVGVGHGGAAAKERGVVARLDAFGHTSCALAGGCMGKKAADCDDGKPCTLDGCAPKTGCSHLPVDAIACPVPKDGCAIEASCDKGVCKPAANGKLHMRLHDRKELGLGGAVVVHSPSGGGAVAAVLAGGLPHRVSFDSLGRFAGKGAQAVSGSAKAQQLFAVATGLDGSTLTLERFPNPAKPGVPTSTALRIVRPTGQVIYGPTLGHPSKSLLVAQNGLTLIEEKPGEQYLAVGYGQLQYKYYDYFVARGLWWVRAWPVTGKFQGPGALGTVTTQHTGAVRAAVARAEGGGLWIAVSDETKFPMWKNGYIRRTNANLSALICGVDLASWSQYKKGFWAVRHVADAGDGALAVLSRSPGGSHSTMVTRVMGNCAHKWTRTFSGPNGLLGRALVPLGDGLMLLSSEQSGSYWRTRVDRLDAGGGVLASRFFALPGRDVHLASPWIRKMADGTLSFMLTVDSSLKSELAAVRTDPWGHEDCAASGGCAAKKADACGDANPCTADLCDPLKGCLHLPVSDGLPCGGAKTCASGICVAKP